MASATLENWVDDFRKKWERLISSCEFRQQIDVCFVECAEKQFPIRPVKAENMIYCGFPASEYAGL